MSIRIGLPFLCRMFGVVFAALLLQGMAVCATPEEAARWKAQAGRVTITRDNWGIPHIQGKSDADAVFGMMYAQAEDDFHRVEMNYVNNLGWLAKAEGEKGIWNDLRSRMYYDEPILKAHYQRCPAWLKTLMIAWADGLNFYLETHKEEKPVAITHFEPWMALCFSEGSIGGDIEDISLGRLQAFYGKAEEKKVAFATRRPLDEQGSNGIAIAPKNTKAGHALLLINPHTSFYFRSEAQVRSDEGLNAYGASTWGQFFVYQGFNANTGWMHTTSGVVRADQFLETIVRKNGKVFYKYGKELRPVQESKITVPYKTGSGTMASRVFTVYRTVHGPIIGADGEKWVSFSMMDRPVEALQQSFLRTKTKDYAGFKKVAELQANSSNNTIFADGSGNIAYMHPHFVPRRDDRFDYTKPVDGGEVATAWKGMHTLQERPNLLNPSNGWIANTNNWPYSAAGEQSPKAAEFAKYMDQVGENARGLHATQLLTGKKDFTLETLRDAAYDSYQPAFAFMIPNLVAAYDGLPAGSPMKASLAEPVQVLRTWDYRWSTSSVGMSLAQFWGDEIWPKLEKKYADNSNEIFRNIAKEFTSAQQLVILEAAVRRLEKDFGTWKTPWGEINRYQRLTSNIRQTYKDDKPSIPVAYTSTRWGSLAAFTTRRRDGTKRYYGDTGNSFAAIVEFGPRVRAIALTAGGQSGRLGTAHFTDQAHLYSDGAMRPVYFYPEDLAGHTERTYRPGEK